MTNYLPTTAVKMLLKMQEKSPKTSLVSSQIYDKLKLQDVNTLVEIIKDRDEEIAFLHKSLREIEIKAESLHRKALTANTCKHRKFYVVETAMGPKHICLHCDKLLPNEQD